MAFSSNRLVVNLDENYRISYASGIDTVFLNSYMANDFVVRPTAPLQDGQSLWVRFATSQDFETTPAAQKTQELLMARRSTRANSWRETYSGTQSQIEQVADSGFEWYIELPQVVLAVPGVWFVSLSVREIPDEAHPETYTIIATSNVASFNVQNSLAGLGSSVPTDLDILSLYNTAVQLVNDYTDFFPRINTTTGNWETYDAASNTWVDTGVPARGPQGVQGEQGPQGVQGEQGPAGQKGTNGVNGVDGANGQNGATFIPTVSQDGVISWRNDGDLPNPTPVNIRGPEGAVGARGDQGPRGPQGPRGIQGPQGIPGEDGTSFQIVANVAAATDLPAASTALLGRAYSVGTQPPLNIYVCEESDGSLQWINHGTIQGPEGPEGAQGPEGPEGAQGPEGPVFTPTVSADGTISWTNNGGLTNPSPQNIRGPQGAPSDVMSTGTYPNMTVGTAQTAVSKNRVTINSTDLNNLPTRGNGFFQGSNLTNAPFSSKLYWYVEQTLGDNDSWVLQVATGENTQGNSAANVEPRYYRTKKNGAWSAWQQVMTDETVSNPNLLINGDFRVNQRGATSYDATNAGFNKYTVDRLIHYQSTAYTLTPNANGGITIKASGGNQDFAQIVEAGGALYGGKQLTISMSVTDNGVTTVYSGTTIPVQGASPYLTVPFNNGGGKLYLQWTSGNIFKAWFRVNSGKTLTINWWKLELGSVATPFSPRPYGEELALCQRYYIFVDFLSSWIDRMVYVSLPVTLRRTASIVGGLFTAIGAQGGGILSTPDIDRVASNAIVFDFGQAGRADEYVEGDGVALDAEIY